MFNAVLFGGRSVIKSEELIDKDTEMSSVNEHAEFADSIQAARDVLKLVKQTESMEYVLLGIENQQGVDYTMPLRIMAYDTYAYQKQCDKLKEKHKGKKVLSKDEFISGIKKEDKLLPVITVLIYYGEREWDAAKSMHEMLHISEELRHYVNDYKMHLVEVRKNNLVLRNGNNRSLFDLFEILYNNIVTKEERQREAVQYETENIVDKSVIMAIAAATKSEVDLTEYDRKGEISMCTLFEEIAKEGEMKGEVRGKVEGEAKGIIKMGRKYNESDATILDELMNELDISQEQAEKYLEMFGKQN
ncbi:Rpn family recombination-promoting nuclease/putative transposase [Konateibacter massiliensis]|uniref:Rpn family recombination-promoting nuclease/putative transposase n=1 Tax=Konateibacter massiliensis TaxID=2002841 RepID=UPI001F462E8B|nr:Rpn family recombination-promoting nuclease/putative transposase [Konateibacter massiliensis]